MNTPRPAQPRTRRAFSLIEVVIAVLVLAIAVPPTLDLMDAAASGRVDAINTTRATLLATCVLETITADINSAADGLGFEALDDPDAYLNTPGTGLVDRLAPIVEPFTEAGFSYSVTVGPLVSHDGTVSGNGDENVFRLITVRVGYNSATGDPFDLPVTTLVSAL